MKPEQVIAANREEYGEAYGELRWVTEEQARVAGEERRVALQELEGKALVGCKGTKVDCRGLSPGCRICGEGDWSCLFVNGKCNCGCFYCPAPQDEVGEAGTQRLSFSEAEEYADYVARFGFRGVGLSGGEPLVTFERTLAYLEAVKRRFGDGVYVWLYTNGTLLTPEIAGRLRDAGLDEIRLDIGATGYDLKKARLAVGTLPRVTVEIPAIPEDVEVLKRKVVEMADSGIAHLNLHQLRLTPYNFPRLVGREYTFLHGEKVTVLESEQAALAVVRFAVENGIGTPVNYCSFAYKYRFQGVAARRRCAGFIKAGFEDVTENGYLRRLCLVGSEEALAALVEGFRQRGIEPGAWSAAFGRGRLYARAEALRGVRLEKVGLEVTYSEATFRASVSYRNAFREVALNRGRRVVVERRRVREGFEIAGEAILPFLTLIRGEGKGEAPGEVAEFEWIQAGLQDYF